MKCMLLSFQLLFYCSIPVALLAQVNKAIFDKTISVRPGDIRLDSLLHQFARQTGVEFSFSANKVRPANVLQVNTQRQTLSVWLQQLERSLAIRYKVVGNHIILYEAVRSGQSGPGARPGKGVPEKRVSTGGSTALVPRNLIDSGKDIDTARPVERAAKGNVAAVNHDSKDTATAATAGSPATPVMPGSPATASSAATATPGTLATPGAPARPTTPGTPGTPSTPGAMATPGTPATPALPRNGHADRSSLETVTPGTPATPGVSATTALTRNGRTGKTDRVTSSRTSGVAATKATRSIGDVGEDAAGLESFQLFMGLNRNGSGDMDGVAFATTYANYLSHRFSLNLDLRGLINWSKHTLIEKHPITGEFVDASVRFTTASAQLGVLAGWSLVQTDRHELKALTGPFGRFQSASNGDDGYSVYYPPVTGQPTSVIGYDNRTPQNKFMVGYLLSLQYQFTFANNLSLGLAAVYQNDTNGDLIPQAGITVGKRF